MKISKILAFCLFSGLWSSPIQGQTFYDDVSLDIKFEKIKLPLRHARIVGRHPDGSILVMCSNEKEPDGVRETRRFFWVKDGEDPVEETGEKFDVDYRPEMARFDDGVAYFTEKINSTLLYRAKTDRTGALNNRQEVKLEGWTREIRHPHICHPRVRNYPLLLFSTKDENRGDYDIYYSELIDGSWSYPTPLKAEGINTEQYNETYPFTDKDGVLYFSTDRPVVAGAQPENKQSDIWFALPTYLPFWEGASVNPLPAPINSAGQEESLLPTSPNLGSGFLVSDREDGRRTLYHFVSREREEEPAPPRYYALLAGVDDYQYTYDLKSPIQSCRELKEVLSNQYNFSVDLLENPNSYDFLEKIKQKQGLEENEYLLIVFMGHGMKYIRPKASSLPDTVCMLLGRDGNCTKYADTDNTICTEFENCITPEAFANALSLINKPRHILIVLNACRSGLFNPMPTQGNEYENKSRWVIASTKGNLVPDGGPFSPCLIEKLRTGATNIGSTLLFSELYSTLVACVRSIGHDKDDLNKPVYFSLPDYENGGEFPFPSKRK